MGTLTTIPCSPCSLSLHRDLIFMNSCRGDTNLFSITFRPNSSGGFSGKVMPWHNAILGILTSLMFIRLFLHTYSTSTDSSRKTKREIIDKINRSRAHINLITSLVNQKTGHFNCRIIENVAYCIRANTCNT